MISKVVIRNYRIYERFELALNPGMNIIVGDNDEGKSTLLEVITLGLTGRLRGKQLIQVLSPYLFNTATVKKYLDALGTASPLEPPEITIDLFLDDTAPADFAGTNNALAEDGRGVRIRVAPDPDYANEFATFIKDTANVKVVPTEYYKVEWLSFSGNGITFRSIPATASLIDTSSIRLASGADYYLQSIIGDNLERTERVELSRAYRSLREGFADNPAIAKINLGLSGKPGEVTDRTLTLSIDISEKSTWESSLVPHLDDLPFAFIGKGEQNCLKILLALKKKVDDAHIMLVEEPENHVSYSTMSRLIKKISDKCDGKQVLITTHSSYVLNKLGLDNLILVSTTTGLRITELTASTVRYFKRLSGYDTLRVVLAKKAFIVEGPSDELVVQRAYLDKHGHLPMDDGIDIISVRGLSALRFLEIANPLRRRVAVITDNDGKTVDQVQDRFAEYTRPAVSTISVYTGKSPNQPSLEQQIIAVNSLSDLNTVLGKSFTTVEALTTYMTEDRNKAPCALAILESDTKLTMPEYINDAIDALA